MQRSVVLAALALVASLPLAAPATAAPYGAIYAFGDSLSDIGNVSKATLGLIPRAPPYAPGRFSNGQLWIDDLAASLGQSIRPAISGGTDFAVGGATSGTTAVSNATIGDLPFQYSWFRSTVAHPDPTALYTVWIGANDLLDALQSGSPGTTVRSVVPQALANTGALIAALAGGGAKNFLVLTVPDLGMVPEITATGDPALESLATQASQAFNQRLTAGLAPFAAANGLDIDVLDTFALLDGVVADPPAYGFTDATTPCWTGGFTGGNSGQLCSTDKAVQDQHVFWDMLHPTEAAHAVIGDAAYRLVSPPARVAAAAVPEPATLVLLAGGVLGLGLIRRGTG